MTSLSISSPKNDDTDMLPCSASQDSTAFSIGTAEPRSPNADIKTKKPKRAKVMAKKKKGILVIFLKMI